MASILKCGAALWQGDPANALGLAECVAAFRIRSNAFTPVAAAGGWEGDAAIAQLASSMGMQFDEKMSWLMTFEGALAGERGRELEQLVWAASRALSGSGGGSTTTSGTGKCNKSSVTIGSRGRVGDCKTLSEIVQQGLFSFRPGCASSGAGSSTTVISDLWYTEDQIAVVTPWLVSAARSMFLIGQVLCEVLGGQQQREQHQQPQMTANPQLCELMLINALACMEWLGSELCHVRLPGDAVDSNSKDGSSRSSKGRDTGSGPGADGCSTNSQCSVPSNQGSSCSHAALQQLLEQHSQTQQALLQAVQRFLDNNSNSSSGGGGEEQMYTTILQQFETVWGLKTSQLLRDFAASVTAALPVGYCCNNPGCCNLDKLSELQLVAGSGKLCGQCRVARYCGPVCQKAHWKMHKAACRQLATQAAARQI